METPDGATIRIAVDAMGGDYAPEEIVKGALEAARMNPIEILLVGDLEEVEGELRKYNSEGLPMRVAPSEGKITEDEHPVQALRHKPRASVAVATQLVKQGEADAMVSMGSTGAVMANAALVLGTLEGLERPCIGGPFLELAPKTVVVDIGSNLDCRPSLLVGLRRDGMCFCPQVSRHRAPQCRASQCRLRGVQGKPAGDGRDISF